MTEILSAKKLAEVASLLLNKPAIVGEGTTTGAYSRFMTQIAQAVCNFYDGGIDGAATQSRVDAKCWFVAVTGNRSLPSTGGEQKSDTGSARLFWQELLDSVESLTAIADEHGARTLADLFYLQNAILSGGFIDHFPGESNVLEVVRTLFSAAKWESHIKVEYLESSDGHLDFG